MGQKTAAVQLAKHLGADVAAVCDTRHVELVQSLGADRVIDYTQEDFRKGEGYDVIFDAVGKLSFLRDRRAIVAGSSYLPRFLTSPLAQSIGRLEVG